MTAKKQHLFGMVSVLLIVALLASYLSVFGQAVTSGGSFLPGPDPYIMNATSFSKLQKIANNIHGGIRGIDVSKHNGTINWKKVARSNVDYVFVRSTYGTTLDPLFVENAEGAHQYGLKVGAYHFATFTTTAQMKKEAVAFVKQLKKVNITYPVVLDLENEGGRYNSMKKANLTKLAYQFMRYVEKKGYTVMLYSGSNFIKSHIDTNTLRNYDFWIANYIEQPTTQTHKIWQYGQTKVSGISGVVDINVAYEDLSTSTRRASSSSAATPTPTQTVSTGNSVVKSTSGSLKKSVANSIKQNLNDRYSAGLNLEATKVSLVNTAIFKALQKEVNYQYSLDLPITGQMTREQVNYIASGGFSQSEVAWVTYLVQARLIYLGYMSNPSGVFDSETVSAVKEFQQLNDLEVDGTLNAATLHKLLL